MSTTNLQFPFRIDGRGRSAEPADDSAHLVQLIEQLLFTRPGERVNRPDFGSGLQQLVFAPDSDQLAAATQFLIQGGLQQWLGDRIVVEDVSVEALDATLQITVRYSVRSTGTQQVAQFTRGI